MYAGAAHEAPQAAGATVNPCVASRVSGILTVAAGAGATVNLPHVGGGDEGVETEPCIRVVPAGRKVGVERIADEVLHSCVTMCRHKGHAKQGRFRDHLGSCSNCEVFRVFPLLHPTYLQNAAYISRMK